jgi:hypothetical protein
LQAPDASRNAAAASASADATAATEKRVVPSVKIKKVRPPKKLDIRMPAVFEKMKRKAQANGGDIRAEIKTLIDKSPPGANLYEIVKEKEEEEEEGAVEEQVKREQQQQPEKPPSGEEHEEEQSQQQAPETDEAASPSAGPQRVHQKRSVAAAAAASEFPRPRMQPRNGLRSRARYVERAQSLKWRAACTRCLCTCTPASKLRPCSEQCVKHVRLFFFAEQRDRG